jgi:hypothetical protein
MRYDTYDNTGKIPVKRQMACRLRFDPDWLVLK